MVRLCYSHFAPPHPRAMLTKNFHQTQVCIQPFSNKERWNGGVDTYSVGIAIMIVFLAFSMVVAWSYQIDVSFLLVCLLIDHNFLHNIVKAAVDPRGIRRLL